jgi:hypothetical protein
MSITSPDDPVVCRPDHISILFRDEVTREQRLAFEGAVGLPDSSWYDEGNNKILKKATSVFLGYKVPEGHARNWLRILKEVPIVREAHLEAQLWASASHNFSYHEKRSAFKAINFSGSEQDTSLAIEAHVADQLDAYFSQRYSTRGRLRVLRRSENCLHLTVEELSGEVISNPRMWERIQFYSVFFCRNRRVTLNLVVDGYYAPGMGKTPPAAENYHDMDLRYYAELQTFTQETAESIRQLFLMEGHS